MRSFLIAIAAAGLLGNGTLVIAHHAFSAEFDSDKPLNFPEATVVKVEWINPHTWVHLDVKNPDGSVERWMIEGGAPNGLIRRGLNSQVLKPGTVVALTAYQAKDGSKHANGRDITFRDGRKLFLGSSGTGAPYDTDK
jgi:hypothetical protein